jgi:hypothetical protein
MAQVVSIAVELDDSGAVQGVRNIEGALTKVGQKGNVVFTGLRQDQERAHEATNLFVRTLGIEMPRALEKVIAKSELIGPLMSTAFKATVVLAVISALVALIPKIESAAKSLGGFTEEMQQVAEAQNKANGDALVTGRTLSIARQNLDVINANIQAKQEYVKLLEKDNTLTSFLMGPTREIKANEESLKDVKKDLVALDQERLKAAEQLARKEAEIQNMIENSAKKAGLAGLSGVSAISEQRRQDLDDANKLEAQGVLTHAQAETQKILATLAASREIGAIRRGQADETRKAEEAATLATLEGKPKLLEAEAQFAREANILVQRGELLRADADRRIAANHKTTQELIRQEDQKTAAAEFAALQSIIAMGNKETDAMVDENTKRAQDHLEVLHTIVRAERDAAIAIADANGDTATAIRLRDKQRVDDALAGLARLNAGTEESARMRAAVEAQERRRYLRGPAQHALRPWRNGVWRRRLLAAGHGRAAGIGQWWRHIEPVRLGRLLLEPLRIRRRVELGRRLRGRARRTAHHRLGRRADRFGRCAVDRRIRRRLQPGEPRRPRRRRAHARLRPAARQRHPGSVRARSRGAEDPGAVRAARAAGCQLQQTHPRPGGRLPRLLGGFRERERAAALDGRPARRRAAAEDHRDRGGAAAAARHPLRPAAVPERRRVSRAARGRRRLRHPARPGSGDESRRVAAQPSAARLAQRRRIRAERRHVTNIYQISARGTATRSIAGCATVAPASSRAAARACSASIAGRQGRSR